MTFTWFSPKVRKCASAIDGTGLIAVAAIGAGDLVVVKGGHVFTRDRRDDLARTLGPAEIQIDDHLFIGPTQESERDGSMMSLNHSCDPNLGIVGQIAFHALRDIAPGEELTFDYATGDDDDWTLDCNCGARACRKRVTGRDWRLPAVQEKYRGWFSAYLARRIAAARDR